MTTQAPIPEPTNYHTSAEVRSSGDVRQEDSQAMVKEVLLRHVIERAAGNNERLVVTTGVAIVDLSTNRTLSSHNQDTEQFAASINKLPVSLLLLEDLRSGKLSLDTALSWTADDRRGGFGVYDQPDSPLSATLGEVLHDMLNKSGNTAVRILVNNALGGAAAVNERLALQPELSHTRLQPLDANRFFLGNSTAHDSMWVAGKLMEHQDSHAQFMRDAMATNIFEDFGVRSQLDKDHILLINKIGLLDDVEGNNRHDVGVIYNKKTGKSYAYSFMTTAPYSETDPAPTNRAEQSLREMGRATLRYAGSKKERNILGNGKWRQHVEERIRY